MKTLECIFTNALCFDLLNMLNIYPFIVAKIKLRTKNAADVHFFTKTFAQLRINHYLCSEKVYQQELNHK